MLKGLVKPVKYLKGVGEKRSELYEKMDIKTVYDLLYHFPRYYFDLTAPVDIRNAPTDESCVVRARVVRKLPEAHIRKGMTVYKAVVTDDTADLTVVMYNTGFIFSKLELGEDYYFIGRVTGNLIRRELSSPQIFPGNTAELLEPVYRLTEGISQQLLRQNMRGALEVFDAEIYEPVPPQVLKENELCALGYALKNIHFPTDGIAKDIAKRRLVFDEFLTLQLGMLLLKDRTRERGGCVMEERDMSAYYDALPFELTAGQRAAIEDCCQDMCREHPMNRLVQGDVGSGKTAVAAGAAYFAHLNGCQSALMAPTEILASQHYETLKGFLEPLGVKVVLLTGSMTAKEKKLVKEGLAAGEYDVAVGTHALVQKTTGFKKLGLVITDEQHRFGTSQRAALAEKGLSPHKIVMSATPIPRTLALMIYGDLDISVLRELPKGRQPVETYAVTGKLRERAYGYVKKYLDEGRQAYVICPMVEDNDSELKDVRSYAKRLAEGEFSRYEIGLLHGKMPAAKKEQVMKDFKDGRIDLLVATTVVEVGVDVPNAAIMLIENSDRFGLSQLHQLRGRVGRGKHKSSCILITDNPSDEVKERLRVLSRTSDGFEISREDLKMRGPGDFFGSRQHGLPKLRIADMADDSEVLKDAQRAAKKLLDADPDLSSPENKGLKELVELLFSSETSDN
ncbi:MAG: ATP-dependent DNA helicase RecG [Ruminococcus sp.]|nr:ATP-dependent DNA helicase RecG [Ruminococcus sp.]